MPAQIDAELLTRYDVPTPRYTSYPTALSFVPIEAPPPPQPDDAARPLSLYFHLPFCRNLCWYCACTRVITRQQSRSGPYLDRVFAEFETRMPWMQGRMVEQLHLGGGTPTFLTADELRALSRYVHARLAISPHAELSVEIDPRELQPEQVEALASGGTNAPPLLIRVP